MLRSAMRAVHRLRNAFCRNTGKRISYVHQSHQRYRRASSGKRVKRCRSRSVYARSFFGIIQLALRWKIDSRRTRGAIAGMNWIALAAFPITATLRPSRSQS